MIEWPPQESLRPEGREGLRRFRESGACEELECSAERWRVAAWPWTDEPPDRVALVNAAGDELFVILDDDGIWRFEAAPLEVRARTPEELEEEARADLRGASPDVGERGAEDRLRDRL